MAQLDSNGSLPAGTSSDTGSAGLQGDLETVLGLNSETGFLGTPDPIGSLANLSADSTQALNAVLADGAGNDQALQELLAQALNASSSGMDRTRSAATVVNATGVLRSGASDQMLKALDALRGTNLGLAATGIDAGISSSAALNHSSLQAVTSLDANSQSFNRTMSAKLEEAVAGIDSSRPRRRSQARAGANDLLISGASLLTSATTDLTAIDVDTSSLADQLLAAPVLPTDAFARLAARLPRVAVEPAVDRFGTDVTTDNALDAALAGRPVAATRTSPEALTDRAGGITAEAASATPRTTTQTSPDLTTPSVTREPRYAEIAASMNMGAAVYRFQTTVAPNRIPPGEVDPLRTVLQIRSTPAINRVA
ncbi:MAG: hypothetical protein HZA62_09660 [Rhodocyclales bacterium]|nr:hypothetical protein [Rhodocyclales bacterium]